MKRLAVGLVILFGSFARGRYKLSSDTDILVVAESEVGFLGWIKLLVDLNGVGLPRELMR